MRGALGHSLLVAAAVMMLPYSAGAEAVDQPDKSKLLPLAADLYVAVTQGQSSDVVAPLVERAIARAGFACKPLRDYQILHGRGEVHTLKVKCAERPTYQLTLNPATGIQVTGGDGSIQPIDPRDGPVTAVWGVRAEHFLAAEASQKTAASVSRVTKKVVAATSARALPGGDGWATGLWPAALLTLLLALPLLVWFNMRPSQVIGFTSADKDQLMEESREILPEIFQHPDGWFIVRGQRGKRRVFRTLLFAYLYRNYGVKLREVR